MWVSNSINRVFQIIHRGNKSGTSKFVIPYGKHSFGPQPELIGLYPDLTIRKARGSQVGNFCSISWGLRFTFLGKLDYSWVSAYPFYEFYDKWKVNTSLCIRGKFENSKIQPNPIIIENDVWIASNVTIKEGVRIGSGSVVAMNSVVTKDVPPYALVGGNPARVIKFRFDKKQIAELLRIAWWNWEDIDVSKVLPLLLSGKIDSFIESASIIVPKTLERNSR